MLVFWVLLVVAFVMAAICYNAVLDELRRSLPRDFHDNLNIYVGAHVWGPLVSDEGRQQYVASCLWAVVGMIAMGGLALRDHPIHAALAALGALVGVVGIAWQSYDYWVRRPKKRARNSN